ncbi:MAG TPA: ABC transporter permease [Ilumatobacteraceae bacterium]|nr:ABC transporter permease [Ilumatobacteraceae bacterium]
MISRLRFDKYSALYLWALFIIIFGITEGDTYLSWTTFELVLIDPAVFTGTLALAFLIPLSTGTFDLAIGANMSMALCVSAKLASEGNMPDWCAMLVALGCCAFAGFLSGFFVVKLKVNSFIATLGMSQVITAFVLRTAEQSINDAFDDGYRDIGRHEIFGLPAFIYYMFILAIITWYIFEHTPIGRHMFATGGNPEAARLAGVRTDRLIWGSLVASGVVAGFAGIIYGWRTGNYNNTVGPGYLFPAIAAVFFGASQLKGRPNVWGTFIALYALAWGIKGLQLTFVTSSRWISPLFTGVSLLAAVSLASRQSVVKVRKTTAGPEPEPEPPPAAVPAETVA